MTQTQRASQIPVMTPRASHNGSNLPSALPQLGLVPPSRYPSVSGSPTLPSPGSSPSPPSNGGGNTPFRTFRNFLSFGTSSKHTPSPSLPSAIPKSHFSTLGPLRRSVNVERRASSPQLVRRSEDDYVLTIDVPRPGDEKSPNTRLSKSSDPSTTSRSPLSCSQSLVAESTASPAGTPAVHTSELSTILEAETSGISKHLPSLDSSQAESERESDISPNAFQPRALYPPPRNTRHGSSSPSNDTSALDLSTSKLRSEVLAALSESGGKQDWLNGVVVDDVPSDCAISRERTPESPDTSFSLNSLDPDLAALLSPNRVRGDSTEPAILVAIDAIPPPTSSPPVSPKRNAFFTATSPRPTTSSEVQASTSARRIPTSLSAAPRLRPNSSFLPPPITRSVSDRSGFTSAGMSAPPSPVTRTPPGRMSVSPDRPLSMISGSSRSRLLRASPRDTTTTANSTMRTLGSSENSEERGTSASRLMTPSRSYSANPSRPPLSRFHATPSSIWDAHSASPPSRAPSSIGTAPSRLQNHRPSLDIERPRLTGNLRARKRSTSVIENMVTAASPLHHPGSVPGPRNMTDWLGPRTAKAFAAAGLLDLDKDSPGSSSRPSSRFGTSRSSIDRDSRSRYTPSRMAYSEAGSTSSYGARSGSVSRAAGYPEGAVGPMGEMSPRTVFSSASTTPTSVSASSFHSEIQQLQDKHALETSALLNALADSQRTTHVLRDENGQLRERIQMLEDKLADAQERIQAILYSQPPAIPPNPVYSKRYASPGSSERRAFPTHSRKNSFLRARAEPSSYPDLHSSPDLPSANPETAYDVADAFKPPSRKRASTTSSMFALLPSNMSMIMKEERVSPDSFSQHSSSPPGSPTMVLARLHGGNSPGAYSSIPKPSPRRSFGHVAKKSASSAGNISPTTGSFSIMTSSPGSLYLRPEHERHLGDMPPLDLDSEEFDFDDS
ncbi:hypothetical protein LXA43DRAFT_737751 [Ganoderma leucocontextum]|nr:hypothetical protein LXA43DRAFT_737751 [Ganoderma leucocontextum]